MRLYGCFDHAPRPVEDHLDVQSGWVDGRWRRVVRITTRWNAVQCGHTDSYRDAECDSCRWRVVLATVQS